MEDGSELCLEVMRGEKEWYVVARTTDRRWNQLNALWILEDCEIKFKKQGGATSILKLT
jgi:hypothetical protein